ncbi:hypothetical protein [Sulfuricystis multivorans]|uniref:hypothetical protein n=1 Tax=Sulfuricystis multivorans TaxID=2211108 RepID=UPI000F81B37C|nr:hypothetical protein [Sulfuricystis multivorans]
MHPDLSFDQAPPIDVPFRFFLTAPLFGIAAGLLLAIVGGEMFASRWMPSALAGTHLLVLGFMLQTMCGALLQFLPVAAGANVWRPRLVAGVVHPLLIVSAVLLVTAFLGQQPGFFMAAAHGLALALGFFAIVTGIALLRTPARGATVMALRLALVALVATVSLGIVLATGLARGSELPLLALTDLHAAWGLGGWALILLAGVSYYVVPMFQLTPAYPAWLARSFPFALIAVLLGWSLLFDPQVPTRQQVAFIGGVVLSGVFALATLRLQSRRRRKVRDATFLFFRTAMLALLAVIVSVLVITWLPALQGEPRGAVWIGLLAIVGVFVSAINGMLYKIVPFLNWLHLQNLCGMRMMPPTMHQMIPEKRMLGQFRLHLAALAFLLAAVFWPLLARLAGLLFAASCAWLGYNLLGAVGVYRDFKTRIRVAA